VNSFFRRLFYAVSYLGNPPWDTGVSPPELMAFIETHPPGRALDLGCGTGTNLVTLAKCGWQVYGVDFSNKAVRTSRQRLQSMDVCWQVFRGDVSRDLAVVGKFDLILDIGCYHDLSQTDRAGYRSNIKIRLVPGGTFLIYAHCLSSTQPKATGVAQEDIEAFSNFLMVKEIVYSTDHWERKTMWMTFINPE
jgi:cyclopropane fatty-acyl-phospholipid synthase-like methyltransferase